MSIRSFRESSALGSNPRAPWMHSDAALWCIWSAYRRCGSRLPSKSQAEDSRAFEVWSVAPRTLIAFVCSVYETDGRDHSAWIRGNTIRILDPIGLFISMSLRNLFASYAGHICFCYIRIINSRKLVFEESFCLSAMILPGWKSLERFRCSSA